MNRTTWIISIVLGVLIGGGLAWQNISSTQAIADVRTAIEHATEKAGIEANGDPKLLTERFVYHLDAIDTSKTPEDFQSLFMEYKTLFQRGLEDYRKTGQMGRHDAEIQIIAEKIINFQ